MILLNDKVALLTLEWLPYAQIHIPLTSIYIFVIQNVQFVCKEDRIRFLIKKCFCCCISTCKNVPVRNPFTHEKTAQRTEKKSILPRERADILRVPAQIRIALVSFLQVFRELKKSEKDIIWAETESQLINCNILYCGHWM